jgi:hypothetical protein
VRRQKQSFQGLADNLVKRKGAVMKVKAVRALRLMPLLLSGLVWVIALPSAVFAISRDEEVTAKYMSRHPSEFSIRVTKEKDDAISFEIKHDVPRPMYHVAHLAFYRKGKLIAETSTPLFGKRHDNTFYFSVAPEFLAETKFDLSDGAFADNGEDATPLPGTVTYRFHVLDFVPKTLLEATASK